MNLLKKTLSAFLFLIILLQGAVAANSFNSFAGAKGIVVPDSSGIPEFKMNGSFIGQYNNDNRFIFRGDFGIRTEDILSNGFFNDTTSYFTINQLSATFRFTTSSLTQQISAFIGNFESLGSDEFLQKYYGTDNFSSVLFKKDISLFSEGMINYSGAGLSYSMTFADNKGMGFYFYYDEKYDFNFLNLDYRYTATWNSVILDAGFGCALPLEKTDSNDNEVFLLIRRCDIHAGFSILMGNNPVTNLFIQAGLLRFQIDPMPNTQNVSLRDLFLFVEPRFTGELVHCKVSFFCVPDAKVSDLPFIPQPIGCDFSLSSNEFMLFNNPAEFGFHAAIACRLTDNYGLEDMDLQITPYMNYSLLGGDLQVMIQFHPLSYSNFEKFLNFSFGYKVLL